MSLVLMYLIVLGIGYVRGSYLRKKLRKKFSYSSMLQVGIVYVNVAFMGVRIGLNDTIIKNFLSIGLTALLFTVVILVCAVFFTSISRKLMGFDKLGEKHKNVNYLFIKEKTGFFKRKEENERKIVLNNMTVNIIFFAAVGVLLGYHLVYRGVMNGFLFNGDMTKCENFLSTFIMFVILSLIYLIGIDLGYDKSTMKHIKDTGLSILVFPIINIIGTTIGCIIVSFILKMKIVDAFACGQGYSWFSLAPNILLSFNLVEYAAISFISNVLREVLSFVFIPIVANYIGYIESISLGGAASMDDCLPIVAKSTTPVITIYSFVSGTILTMLVPMMVTFFASMVK